MPGGLIPGSELPVRQAVADEALAQLQHWGSLAPETQAAAIQGFWDEVGCHDMMGRAWCGAFALRCLKAAGAAPQTLNWVPGVGFLGRHCTVTSGAEVGDIAYFPVPWQHHAVIVGVDGDTITTVDGNQPGILQHSRPRHAMTVYSISPLLDAVEGRP